MGTVELLEAILWTPSEGFFLLDRHLRRISCSAEHFRISLDLREIRDALQELADRLPRMDHKVRLTAAEGRPPAVTAQPLMEIPRPAVLRVGLAAHPVNSVDVLRYHKTSRRGPLDRELAVHRDWHEVVLWNERGEITESCTANVVIEMSGARITPPLASGLLPGTFRGHLLDQGLIAERTVRREELLAARSFWLINSVRKWMPARLVAPARR